MGKAVALMWIPASIGITALAVANIIEHLYPGSFQWMAPFAAMLKLYGGFTQQLNEPISNTVQQYASMSMPSWTADGLVAYTATATGFAMGGSNFTGEDDKSLHALRSSAASMGWPLALLTFAWNGVRNQTVSKFAPRHTALFVLYLAAVGLVLAGAHWGTQLIQSHTA